MPLVAQLGNNRHGMLLTVYILAIRVSIAGSYPKSAIESEEYLVRLLGAKQRQLKDRLYSMAIVSVPL